MKNYKYDNVRNIALLGHGSSGKTTLTEAILYTLKQTKRMGRVEDGTTVSDYDKSEMERGFSIGTSVIPVEWNNSKYNIIDTPGYFDFVGETFSSLRVAGSAVIMVDASSGIEVGTEKAWRYCEDRKMPRLLFINKMDKENIDYVKVIRELKEKFGKKVAPFAVPWGIGPDFKGFVNVVDLVAKEFKGDDCVETAVPEELMARVNPIRDLLIEAVAESDEELMEKYFEGEEFTTEEIHEGLRKGVISNEIVPVLVGSATERVGLHTLLDMVFDYMPTPHDMHEGIYEGVDPESEETVSREVDENAPLSALVFKTVVDPFVGKISMFKVYSGKFKKDMEVLNATKDETEKIGTVFLLRGKEQLEVDAVLAGDIGATSKLQHTETGDTLCDKSSPIRYKGINYPKPCIFMAVEPKSKGDEEKIGQALHKLVEEDPTFIVQRNKETKQLLIGGQGTMQLGVVTNKLKNIFSVEVDLVDQKIAYRETIKGTATVQGKYKKQSGGSGQYGDVHIQFEPCEEEFVFEEKIFGGSVPRNYIPAVEKGLHDCIEKGVLAGFPVVNIKATLLDGSYHAVDSSEMAFKMAASVAFKKGIQEAKPILLEPIYAVNIFIPESYMGDIMGDMNRRRGRVLGMEAAVVKGFQKVVAEAPLAEMFKYATELKSMTHARGWFDMEFTRYEEVPSNLVDKIIQTVTEEE
ncbi:elongation factor G [Acidaminobacter sp. JC074]|uniref:elongation factor G n=1 Tax=Acidaminobacter sp. JC074 TaxID=2530199 RepID=UPI001F1030EF|nr:elongation factor G [Acidaminobacter sp. JC074]MCH4890448.1 elongation factor G [Acidaminobacter sp. JC074]